MRRINRIKSTASNRAGKKAKEAAIAKAKDEESLSTELIQHKIYFIRGKKVMLDRDLAVLYDVPTKALNQAVKRNADRFPEDFMFQLSMEEYSPILRSQSVTLRSEHGAHPKYPPFAFTEQGIAMLSSVLNSKKAIHINIQIIRTFTKLREMIDAYKDLREKVEELEKTSAESFEQIFYAIKMLIRQDREPRPRMGFKVK